MSLSISGQYQPIPSSPHPPTPRNAFHGLMRNVTALMGLALLLNYFKSIGAIVVTLSGDSEHRNLYLNSQNLSVQTYPNGVTEQGIFNVGKLEYGFRNYSQESFDFGSYVQGELHGPGFRQFDCGYFCSGNFANGKSEGNALCMIFSWEQLEISRGIYALDTLSTGVIKNLYSQAIRVQYKQESHDINVTESRDLGKKFNSTITDSAGDQQSIISDFPPYFDPYDIPLVTPEHEIEALPIRSIKNAQGDQLEGHFFCGRIIFGTMTSTDGRTYQGPFDHSGRETGIGRTVFLDGTVEVGLYLGGRFIGGEVTHANGIREIGRRVNTRLEGDRCTRINANEGPIYYGTFVDSQLNGNGSIVSASKIEIGLFKDGNLVSGEQWDRANGIIRVGDFSSSTLIRGYVVQRTDDGFARINVDGEQMHHGKPTEFPDKFNPYDMPKFELDSRLNHLPRRSVTDQDGATYEGYFVGESIVFGTKHWQGMVYRGYFDSEKRMHGLGTRLQKGVFEERGYFYKDAFIGGTVKTQHYSDTGPRKDGTLHGTNATRVDMNGNRVMQGQFYKGDVFGMGTVTYLRPIRYIEDGYFIATRLITGRKTVFLENNSLFISFTVPLENRFKLKINPDGLAKYFINDNLVLSGTPPMDPHCIEVFQKENTPILRDPVQDQKILKLLPSLPEWIESLWAGYRQYILTRSIKGTKLAKDRFGVNLSEKNLAQLRKSWGAVATEFPKLSREQQFDFLAALSKLAVTVTGDDPMLTYLKDHISLLLKEDWQVLSNRRPIARADLHIYARSWLDIPALMSFVDYINKHRHPDLSHVSLIPYLRFGTRGFDFNGIAVFLRNDQMYRDFASAIFSNHTLDLDELTVSDSITVVREIDEFRGQTYLLPKTAIKNFGAFTPTYFADNAFFRVKPSISAEDQKKLDDWVICARVAMAVPESSVTDVATSILRFFSQAVGYKT